MADLRNDCFALPPGVNWVPVDSALARLRSGLEPVVGTERMAVADCGGRIVAEKVRARRANPPAANSAVDGYGFLHASLSGDTAELPLVEGRSAAGAPFGGVVPTGKAVRILTGALLPDGVDTVVLDEDVSIRDGAVRFDGAVRAGSNTRSAGEDRQPGAELFAAGHKVRSQDLALAAATGVGEMTVFRRLRVGVLSTGDEIVPAGQAAHPHQTHDANRPMLLDIVRTWEMNPVDLGHSADDAREIVRVLDLAAEAVDVVLTSGGASAGEEDHISRVLRDRGTLDIWRIAVKPGRPLALGTWRGVPVFGLPGNPVAAFVCTLVFARPALRRLAGAEWSLPVASKLPAAFSKTKKRGRREYLRARLTADGAVEVFRSEGSGRISGLSWADGLVELGDDAQQIHPGDPVDYLPFSVFGL